MGSSYQFAFYLSIASAILALLFAGRIHREGLRSIYPYLFAFLIFDAARTLVLPWFPPRTSRAAYLFMATEPVAWILNFLMIREIFDIVLAEHPGIDSVSRRFVRYAMAFAAISSVALLWMDYGTAQGVAWFLRSTFNFGRVALVMLVLLLLAGVTFMSWFPVKITRNASTLLTGYAIYFGSKGILLLMRNMLGDRFNTVGSQASIVVYAGCLMLGTVLLSSGRESRDRKYRSAASPAEAERLMAQLQEMNRKLEETVRR